MGLCRLLFIIYLFPFLKSAPLSQLPLVFLSGVLFDIQALVYLLAPFHLLSLLPTLFKEKQRNNILKVLFILGLGIGILLNYIDLEFYKIKTRRSGIELFQLLGDSANPVLSYIINYWWLLLLLILNLLAIFFLYPKAKSSITQYSRLQIGLRFMLFASLLVLGARGTISIKPLRSFDAARFVDPQWVSATINSPTQLITSYSSSIPEQLHYMSDEEAIIQSNVIQVGKPIFKTGQKPNVVLIILESFGRDYCGFLNEYNRYTPFLDSLSKHALVFPHTYSSGTTSMESIPAIFTSIPSLLEVPYINSNYQNNTLYGIHHYLSKAKYDCSFYYGTHNGSMGFDNFLKITGPIDYFGLNEYSGEASHNDGSWGIWDEEYLQYYSSELNKKKQPFFSTVFTLTSHDPYEIPSKYKGVFKGGELPIYKAVQYTDNALRLFFKNASKSKWFDNTIFIITADHPSHSVNEYFYTPTGKYEIPLMFYSPKLIPAGNVDSVTASQPDIMPTIMNLCGIQDKYFAFGRNLFDFNIGNAINKDYGIAQLVQYPYCLRLFPDGKFKMYFQSKTTLNSEIRYNLTPEEKELQKKLEIKLKARLQTYNKSLLDNTAFVK